MKKFLFAALAAVAMTSCVTYTPYVPPKPTYNEATARSLVPTHNAVIVPLVADLEVVSEDRIEYVETFDTWYNNKENMAYYKQVTLRNANKHYNADVMVAPIFNITTDKDGKLVITLTGFPARYVKFRSMNPDEYWLLDTNEKSKK